MGSFNARRKATNFTDEAFEQACRAAHLAGSRVYVTVNIVIKQSEMGDALQLIHRCSTLGADAFIIQDWGLFFEAKRTMPGIETHISTQANIHDDRGTLWCREQGADRVTLSRELSIDEIAAIHDAAPDVDLEVFSHGAICFCYSGLCLLSSFAMAGRSANRGMCAQPCRLPYELIDENGRALSPAGRERALCPRDTNTSQLVRRLYDAGAASLKLEGRMKAPDYVYSIVDVYRHEIDDMLSGAAVAKDEEAARQRQLKRCFNRDFTHAYQDGTSGDEMMSYERSNNRGQIVGTVLGSRPANRDVRGLKSDDRRRRAAIARIELFEPVGKGDLLELRHDNEFDQFLTTIAADDAAAGDIIECRVPRSMPEGCRVRVIRSQRAIDAAGAALKRDVLRRRAVDVTVVARLGEPFTVTLTCCDDPALTATATGFTVEAAKTRAVEASDLVEHVGRMGSSPFEAASFDVALDEGCGMGFSAVHKVRAAACKALEEAILAPYEERAKTLELPAIVTSDSRPAPEALPRRAADLRHRHLARGRRGSPRGGCNAHLYDHRRARGGRSSPLPMRLSRVSCPYSTRSAAPSTTSASTRGSMPEPRSPSATSLSSPWPPRSAPRPRFALACPCTTRPAWRHLPSAEPVRFGSRPRSHSTRSSRLAPPRPQPWASLCSAARAL